MELVLDPTAWVGLLTLVLLEIVLGIDNLVFIAILVDKLPPAQRDKARVLGLSLALLMRLALLSIVSWLIQLTKPIFWLGSLGFSGRDLILIIGGFFLILKATIELHDRVDGKSMHSYGPSVHAGFGVIVTQIVVLDAIFSLDSVITAVGMVDHIAIMMAAVIIAIGIMLLASKALTDFVNARPGVVILCLGFLLMIGFSLLAEGFNFVVPKGYLYSAIGFAVLIEATNQLSRHNLKKIHASRPLRERTADAVLRMLSQAHRGDSDISIANKVEGDQILFEAQEQYMVSGVLTLAERSVHSIMTPRTEVSWLNLNDDAETLKKQIISTPHSFFPVCNGSLDDVVGIGRAKEMVSDLIQNGKIDLARLRAPVIVHESIDVIRLMETLRRSGGLLVLVTDEFGSIVGLLTAIDVFKAIAGDFPDEDEAPDVIQESDNSWWVDGSADLHHLEMTLDIQGLVDENETYSTIAGYLLDRFDHLPSAGDKCDLVYGDFRFEFTVLDVKERRISAVRVNRRQEP